MNDRALESALQALDLFKIETPSWGYSDTGTRFGKYYQDAAAIDLSDKLDDAAHVHRLTGCCPTVAVHVQWDFQPGQDPKAVGELAKQKGTKIGSINPNLFQDQHYKWGSFANSDAGVRQAALDHVRESIEIGKAVGSDLISLWFADGTSYPGQESIVERKHRFEDCLVKCHEWLGENQQMLIEYKPFEPTFYHTDVGDWGMAYILAKKAGPKARVLVDTGHHYTSQNIEQIVAFLLDEGMLGGFHFNDRRYADDDLTFGSIDPYQAFRIFFEIHSHARRTGNLPDIAYMIDQSHNEKPKLEATIQTVIMAQELFVKASLVDFDGLVKYQSEHDVVMAELELKKAFFADVSPAILEWRKRRDLPADPLQAHRDFEYEAKAAEDRSRRRREAGLKQESSYA